MDTPLAKAGRDGGVKRAALGVAVAGGALAAAKLGWDRLSSSEDLRRFRLRDGERVPGGLQRIACSQLDMSIERLEGHTDEELGAAVHETRKSLKRLRATVRLARDELAGGGGIGWAEIAQRCGYYDQAHMVADFQQFTGHSPSAYVALRLPDGGGVIGD